MLGRRRVRIRCAKRSYWALSIALLAVGTTPADAQNATWVGGNGGDPGEWVELNNWTPTTVPSGTATFTNTGVTTIANDAGIVAIGAIGFTANAQAYTINIDNPFIVKSAGVTNSSTNTQTFNVTDGNTLVFQNGSTANNGSGAVSYNNSSFITFENSSNAGNANATITNNDILQFNDSSSAGSAHITNNVETDFFSTSTAGSANITNASNGTITFNNNATANAATIGNAGIIDFYNSSNAGTTANITNSGVGATITFNNSSSAGGATITNESGGTTTFNAMTTAGGATITTLSGSSVAFAGNSTGGNAQFITNGTGFVDFSGTSGPTGNHQISAGSIAGSGNYFLGANALTVGGNTTVSGVISDCGTGGTQCARSGATGGSLIKAGTGTLTLSGVNTYTGSTTINSGATLALSGSGSISNSSVVTANGTFDISGVGPGFFSSIKSLAGSGGVYLGDIGLVITAASTEFSGVISDGGNNAGLEISGGTQTLSGVNTYTNTTQIDSGATLALKGGGSIANSLDVAFSGGVGTFDISQTSAGASVGALFSGSTTSRVSLGAQTLTITGGSFFDGVIQDGGIGGGSGGSIAIAAFADQALGGTNTYTGSTTINATGELDLISNGAHNGSIANSSGVADNGLFDISDLGNHGTTPVSTSITSLSGSAGGMVNLGENTLTITNASGTFAGVIADGGTSGGVGGALAINSGTEILTGANTYTGATAINGGTLEVDGSIASSSQTTVANNGTLQGIGTVGNLQVNSGGAFAPGAVGSSNTQMNVQGSLAFQSGAFYVTQVSPSSATFANVTGTASLAGTVIATFSTGSYLTKNYLILQSAGLSGTTFGTLDTLGLPRGATASLSYTADDVFLDLSVSLSATGLNTNQKNVANAINAFFNSGGALPPNFASLIGLSGSPLATALTQLDGEANADAEKGAFQLMSDFLNLMLDPSSGGGGGAGGGGTGGSGALGFAPERDATLPPEIALAYNSMLTKALPKPQSFDQRWTAWGSAFGGTSHTNGDPVVGSNNVDASDYGFAGGADYRVSRDTVLGFALAGGGTNWNLAQGLGNGRSDAFQAGVYAKTHAGPAYLSAALAFANNWFTTDRTSAFGDQLQAKFQGQSYGGRIEAGYRYGLPSANGLAGFTPYAAVQAQSFHTPSYTEIDLTGGGFGLAFNAMTATDTRSELGSRFDDLAMLGVTPLILRARLAWAHDWISNPALGAAFQTLPGTNFVVNGAAPPKDSALASLGAELRITADWSLLGKFDGQFGNGAQTYAGTGTLRYTW